MPEGWAWARLRAVAEAVGDGDHQPPPQTTSGIPFLVISDVSAGKLSFENTRFVGREYYENLPETRKPRKGDLLFTVTGSYGIPILVDTEMEFCFQRHIAIIHPCLVTNCYLYLVLGSSYTKSICDEKSTGTAQKTVGLATLREILIPIAPYDESFRIFTQVKKTLNLVKNISSNNEKLLCLIESTKAKILDLAIHGRLVPQDPDDEPASVLLERVRTEKEDLIKQGKIKRNKKKSVIFKGDDNSYYQDLPEMWELVNFEDCATLISGRDLNKNEYNAESIGIPYITGASNFINGSILINRWTTVSKTISEVNDILITCKGTVGELAINKYGNIHIARQIMAIRVYENINLEYIKLFLESIVMEIKKTANGLIPGISRDDILSLNIPLPPLAEQKRIVEAIEKIFVALDDIANQVT